MMVSTNTRNRQELEDLEFARRLQVYTYAVSLSIAFSLINVVFFVNCSAHVLIYLFINKLA